MMASHAKHPPAAGASSDDARLVEETLGGSQAAFETLVARYQDRIFRLLYRFTTEQAEREDLAQDVFLKAFRRLHTFRFGSAFYTWLYRIAVNTATDFVNRKKRNPVQSVEDVVALETGSSTEGPTAPDRSMLSRERETITRTVLERMPEKYRTILILREYEEMAYDEIAETLGCALGTVESRLYRAREKFREILERIYPEYASGDQEHA